MISNGFSLTKQVDENENGDEDEAEERKEVQGRVTEPGTARSNASTISGTASTTTTNGGRKKRTKSKIVSAGGVSTGIRNSPFPAIAEADESKFDLELQGPQLQGLSMSERCKALDIWRLRGTSVRVFASFCVRFVSFLPLHICLYICCGCMTSAGHLLYISSHAPSVHSSLYGKYHNM